MRLESFSEAAFAILTSAAVIAVIAFTVHSQNVAVSAARAAGYAAAVDSVRQDEWRSQPIRVLMDSGVPFRIMVGDSGSVIYVSGRTK